MKPLHLASGLLTLTAALDAQIYANLAAPSPVTVTCTEGATTDSDTQPATGLLPSLQLTSLTTNTYAGADAWLWTDALGARCTIGLTTVIGPGAGAGANAAVGPGSVLLLLSAPHTTAVSWQVTFSDTTDAGLPQPGIDIDIGDDGVVDYVNGQHVLPVSPQTLDVAPLPVRVTFTGASQQVGRVAANLTLDVLPLTHVYATPVAVGCAGASATVAAIPTFLDSGVRLSATDFSPANPWVALVIGWDTAPLLLPSYGQAPCLFVPTPDVVLLQGQLLPPIDVPLPAAVRPATFWIQGVIPDSQLLTTDCLRVDAW